VETPQRASNRSARAFRWGNVHSADGWRELLAPVIARYRDRMRRRYFRADAALANPEVYELLEVERYTYTIRLPVNSLLQERIAWILKRPVGRPPHEVRRYHASFSYQAGSWNKPRRVVAKVEWHPGELYPRVGFIVTNLTQPAERVVMFYNHRGTAEQWIKEGKSAVTWTRLSATASPPMQCGCSCTRWPTISPTSCAPWLCPRRSSSGRSPHCANGW
jgi:hypothetical protein